MRRRRRRRIRVNVGQVLVRNNPPCLVGLVDDVVELLRLRLLRRDGRLRLLYLLQRLSGGSLRTKHSTDIRARLAFRVNADTNTRRKEENEDR